MKGKTDKGVRIMAALLSAWSLFGLFGCGKRPAPVSGGIVDQTDSKAPKTIVSKEITAFSADFYLRGEWSPGETGRTYAFEIVPDETGALSAAETGAGIRFPADEALLTALQDMIDEEKLAEKNGVVRYTAGLPPEFQPCHAAVDYASGERLRFTVGNDPDAAWAKRTYLIFADWFAGKGDASLLPPRKTDPVKQVILTLKENKILTEFAVVKAPAENADDRERRILQKRVYDAGAGKSVSTDSAPVPAELGAQITELLNRFDLRPFDEYSVLYEAGREPGEAPAFADADDGIKLCVFYEDGDQLYFELTAASDIALIRPLTEALRDYFEIQFASIQ